MTSLDRPSSARRMILARITSQYGDVYFLAIVSNLTRSSLESLTVNGLLLGIGGRSLPIASVSECLIASAPITRHRIYEWEYLAIPEEIASIWWVIILFPTVKTRFTVADPGGF
jgi:hypothetical protein